jgi:hypothetical protein
MATTITYESFGPQTTGNPISKVTGTISQADMSFRNISNPLAPTNDTVTADKIRVHTVTDAEGATAGIPGGTYEKSSGAVYRRTGA